MNDLPLHRDDEAAVVATLVALDWMESPFETSGHTVERLLRCSRGDAMAIIWKNLVERQIIELRSRFDGKRAGKPIRSVWKWFKLEKSA